MRSCASLIQKEFRQGGSQRDAQRDAQGKEATSRQVVYEALCSDLELLAQPAMSAGTTS